MKFGTPTRFAIEANLLKTHQKWIYGQLRFYVGGRSIGDFDDSSDLATSARWGRTFLQASSRRTRPDLDNVSAVDVFDLLYGRYVVSAHEAPAPTAGASMLKGWDRDPYLLDEIGESALRDKYTVLVIRRGDNTDRVVVKSYDDGDLFETIVDTGVIDDIVDTYCTWVEGLPTRAV